MRAMQKPAMDERSPSAGRSCLVAHRDGTGRVTFACVNVMIGRACDRHAKKMNWQATPTVVVS